MLRVNVRRPPNGPGLTRRAVGVTVSAILALSAGFGAPVRAAGYPSAPCLTAAAADRWLPIPAPAGVRHLSQLDAAPCDLVTATAETIFTTSDGGAHWVQTLQANAPIYALYTEGLGPFTVLAAAGNPSDPTSPETLYISQDGGMTFTQASGTGLNHLIITTAAGDGGGLHLFVAGIPVTSAGAVASLPSVWASADGGSTFTGQPGSTGLNISALAINPYTGAQNLWLVASKVSALSGTPAAGYLPVLATATGGGATLWESSDGGQSYAPYTGLTGAATGIAYSSTSPFPTLLVSEGAGIREIADNGTSSSPSTLTYLSASAVTSVRGGPLSVSRVYFLQGQRPQVLVDRQQRGTASLLAAGLPGSCHMVSLHRAQLLPVVLVGSCTDGRTYRYIDANSGLLYGAGAGTPAGSPPPLVPGTGPGTSPVAAMQIVKILQLPINPPGGDSGNFAVVNGILYYLAVGDGETGLGGGFNSSALTVLRMRISDGIPLPPITLPLGPNHYYSGTSGTQLAGDSRRDWLYIGTSRAPGGPTIYAYDLHRHTLSTVMPTPTGGPYQYAHFSYDPVHDQFSFAGEERNDIFVTNRKGTILRTCTYGATRGEVGTATAAGGGDGSTYVEQEDDSSIYVFDRNCSVVTAAVHATFSEPHYEDESLVCDGQSFTTPVLWLRDTLTHLAVAYAAPFGYCPTPTSLRVLPPQATVLGQVATVCARLSSTAGDPIGDQPVSLQIGTGTDALSTTDRNGLACTPYLATPVGRIPIHATYLGSRIAPQYLPSRGSGSFRVLPLLSTVLPGRALPRAIVVALPPLLPPPPPATLVTSGPAGVSAAAPAPQPVTAQVAQGQAQQQTIGQATIVPQRQKQPQLVFVRTLNALNSELSGEHAMVGLPSPPRRQDAASLTWIAAISMVVAGCAAGRATVSHAVARPACPPHRSRR